MLANEIWQRLQIDPCSNFSGGQILLPKTAMIDDQSGSSRKGCVRIQKDSFGESVNGRTVSGFRVRHAPSLV